MAATNDTKAPPIHDLAVTCRTDNLPCRHMVAAHTKCDEKKAAGCAHCGTAVLYEFEKMRRPTDWFTPGATGLDVSMDIHTDNARWWHAVLLSREPLQDGSKARKWRRRIRHFGNPLVEEAWLKWLFDNDSVRMIHGQPVTFIGNGRPPLTAYEATIRGIRC